MRYGLHPAQTVFLAKKYQMVFLLLFVICLNWYRKVSENDVRNEVQYSVQVDVPKVDLMSRKVEVQSPKAETTQNGPATCTRIRVPAPQGRDASAWKKEGRKEGRSIPTFWLLRLFNARDPFSRLLSGCYVTVPNDRPFDTTNFPPVSCVRAS